MSPIRSFARGQGIFVGEMGHPEPRPVVVLWCEGDRYLVFAGTSKLPADPNHIFVPKKSEDGVALGLSKDTFFESRWCKVILGSKLERDWHHSEGMCPRELLERLDRLVDRAFWRCFGSRPDHIEAMISALSVR